MKKLFEKNEIVFAVILIVVYVVGSSLLGKVSAAVGVRYSAETILAAAMTVFLLVFIRKNGLMKYYGLCKDSSVQAWPCKPRKFWTQVIFNREKKGMTNKFKKCHFRA